jgi:hypothetical protein
MIMPWTAVLLLGSLIVSCSSSQAQQLVQHGSRGLVGPRRHLHSSCDTTPFPELKPVRDLLASVPYGVFSSSSNIYLLSLQTYLESKVAGVEWAGADDQVRNCLQDVAATASALGVTVVCKDTSGVVSECPAGLMAVPAGVCT